MANIAYAMFEYADGVQVCFYRSIELIDGKNRVCHKIIVGNSSCQMDWEAMPGRAPNSTTSAIFYRYFVKYMKEKT